MDNASKALIMAGGVLIGLLIISALVLMFSNLSAYQTTNIESTRDSQIVEFNNKYESYNKKNLRGSELYSLLNMVVDYNRRQTTAGVQQDDGTGWADKGQSVAFEPMKITFTINDKTKFSADTSGNKLITEPSYTIGGNENTFEKEIKQKIDKLEDYYGKDSLTNLSSNLTRIFIDSNSSTEQAEAVNKFNSISKKVKARKFDDIAKGSTYRKDVYTYYEYVQFKRARFNCTGTSYNKNTGRIIELDFEFTGKFN